jgi:hypothetical protein
MLLIVVSRPYSHGKALFGPSPVFVVLNHRAIVSPKELAIPCERLPSVFDFEVQPTHYPAKYGRIAKGCV